MFHVLEVKARGLFLRQRGVAFRAIVGGVTARERLHHHKVAAYGDLHLTIHLQADVALALSGRYIVTGHAANLEAGVREGRERRAEEQNCAEFHLIPA